MIFRKLKSKKIFIILITVPFTLYVMFFFGFEQKSINDINNLPSYEKVNVLFKKFDKTFSENYNSKKNLTLLAPEKNTHTVIPCETMTTH